MEGLQRSCSMAVERTLTRGWPKGDMARCWGAAGALLAAGAPALVASLPALLLASLTLQHQMALTCPAFMNTLPPCNR